MATKLDVLKKSYSDYLVVIKKYLGDDNFFGVDDVIDYVFIYNTINQYFVKNDEKANKNTLNTILFFKNISLVENTTFDEFYEETKGFIDMILNL